MDVCQFHSGAQGRRKLGEKWKYPRGGVGPAVRGREWEDSEDERGGKLYSRHDVRNDSGIMATATAKEEGPVGKGEGSIGRGRSAVGGD